jgi:hypothetical protein
VKLFPDVTLILHLILFACDFFSFDFPLVSTPNSYFHVERNSETKNLFAVGIDGSIRASGETIWSQGRYVVTNRWLRVGDFFSFHPPKNQNNNQQNNRENLGKTTGEKITRPKGSGGEGRVYMCRTEWCNILKSAIYLIWWQPPPPATLIERVCMRQPERNYFIV